MNDIENRLHANSVAQNSIREAINAKYRSLRMLQERRSKLLDEKYRNNPFEDCTDDDLKQLCIDAEDSVEAQKVLARWFRTYHPSFEFYSMSNNLGTMPAASFLIPQTGMDLSYLSDTMESFAYDTCGDGEYATFLLRSHALDETNDVYFFIYAPDFKTASFSFKMTDTTSGKGSKPTIKVLQEIQNIL